MFYKENNFKNTEIGEVPKDWETIKVKDAIEEVTKYAHKIKTREYLARGSFPVVDQSSSFIAGYTNYNAPFTDVPVIVFGDHTGILKYVDFDFVMGADGTKILKSKNAIYAKYLYFVLKGSRFRTEGYRRHMAILRELTISISKNSHEQQKIAEILSNIDTAIQKTNELITSTQRLKTGFMQVLLEKGIEHKKFSDTKVGTIPENWKIGPLKDVCIEPGSSNKLLPDKFEYVDVSSVSNVDFKIHQTTRHTLTTAPSRAKKLIRKDDIILATVRPTLKRIAMIPEELDRQVCSTAFCIVRVNRERVNPKFIFYLLQSDSFIDAISIHQVGATYPAISDSIVLNQFIYIPSLEESNRIVEIISDVDKKLDSILLEKRHLEKIKKKFMSELLSGRIRVK